MVEQPGEEVDCAIATDGFGGLQRKPSGEHGKRPEQLLLVGRQQVVAPGDRVAHGLVTRLHVTGGAVQQREPIGEPVQHGLRGEHVQSRRRKLDRERQSIQRQAYLPNRGDVPRREGEVGAHGPRALDEEIDRGSGGDRAVRVQRRDVSQPQVRYRVSLFAR